MANNYSPSEAYTSAQRGDDEEVKAGCCSWLRIGKSKQKPALAGAGAGAGAGEGERSNGSNGYSGGGGGGVQAGAAGAANHALAGGQEAPSHREAADKKKQILRQNSQRSQKSVGSNALSSTSLDENGVLKRRTSGISKSYVKQVQRANSNRSRGSQPGRTGSAANNISGDGAMQEGQAVSRGLDNVGEAGSISERISQEGSQEGLLAEIKERKEKEDKERKDKDKEKKKDTLHRTPSNLVPFQPQAAGHEEALKSWDDHPGMILKKSSEQEHAALDKLMSTSLKKFCPVYHGLETIDEEQFLVMSNCLFELERPHVMDIKMGQRTFQETEVTNAKLRKDLLEKMNKVDPKEASAEEQEQGITKLRYMQFREKMSTSLTLGFRVDAIHLPDDAPGTLSRDAARKLSDRDQVEEALGGFLSGHRVVWQTILERLKELRAALEQSAWFKGHELVGSSLLFAFDANNPSSSAGVWMIDFAHANPVSAPLSHREEWKPGNHEDGYLIGLDMLIKMWEESLGSKVTDVVVEGAK